MKQVTVFGGSGFVGRHVVSRLAARGLVVRVAVRDVAAASFVKPMGDVGQVTPVRAGEGGVPGLFPGFRAFVVSYFIVVDATY